MPLDNLQKVLVEKLSLSVYGRRIIRKALSIKNLSKDNYINVFECVPVHTNTCNDTKERDTFACIYVIIKYKCRNANLLNGNLN